MGAIAESPKSRENKRAKLRLDNLSSPIVTKVEHKSSERMTVKQALPFLQLETGVLDDEGRRAHIRSVKVSVEGGTPHLVLDLAYDNPNGLGNHSIGLDDTIPGSVLIVSEKKHRFDQTIPFGFQPPTNAGNTYVGGLNPDSFEFGNFQDDGIEIVIESEQDKLDHEPTLSICHGDIIEETEEEIAPPSGQEKSGIAKRAKALAAAFWGYWGVSTAE